MTPSELRAALASGLASRVRRGPISIGEHMMICPVAFGWHASRLAVMGEGWAWEADWYVVRVVVEALERER